MRAKPPFPVLRRDDPLSQGLALALSFVEGAGTTIYDLSGNNSPGTLSGITWTAGRAGWALQTGNSSNFIDTKRLNFGSAAGTILWSLYPTFSPTDSVQRYVWGQTPGNHAPEFSCQKYSDNSWYVGWNTGADYRVIVAASTANLTPNVWQDYALTWDATGSRFYRDGVLLGTNATPPVVQNLTASLYVLNDNGFSSQGMAAGTQTDYFAYHARALSANEIAAWSADPWRWCRPRARTLKAASGSSTFNAPAATAAWTAPAPSFGASSTFSPAAVNSSWTIPTATFSGAQTLTPASALASWNALAPSFGGNTVFAPAGASAGWNAPAPAFGGGGSETFSASVATATWITPAPAFSGGTTFAPAGVSAAWTAPPAAFPSGGAVCPPVPLAWSSSAKAALAWSSSAKAAFSWGC